MSNNTPNGSNLTGPLFIIGMPRSGTKLLRDMLNQHTRIVLPRVETEFLPYLVNLQHTLGDLSVREKFSKFYKAIIRQPYFVYIMEEYGHIISEKEWYSHLREFTPGEIFEVLIRHDVNYANQPNAIWGDKSPGYIRHVKLIQSIYPSAKFVHIVRDVRDYCLSINRAWGKNMYRAAQRWVDDVGSVRTDAIACSAQMKEVRYEDLLANPVDVLKEICAFLGVEYENTMIALQRPTENLGDTRGKAHIISDNIDKYKVHMASNVKQAIETVAADVLRSYNYSVDVQATKRLSKINMCVFKILDGINLFSFSLRERGFGQAVNMRYRGWLQQRRF